MSHLINRARGFQVALFLVGLGAGLSVADVLEAPVVVGLCLVGLGLCLVGLGLVVLLFTALHWPGQPSKPNAEQRSAPLWFWLALLVILLGGLLLRSFLRP